MSWTSHTLRVAAKDLLLQIRDFRTLTVLLLMPLVLVAILGTSIQGILADQENFHVQLVVFDQGKTALSRKLLNDLSSQEQIEVTEAASLSEAEDRLFADRKTCLVVIGPKFEKRAGELELLDVVDPSEGPLKEGLPGLDIHLRVRSIFPLARFTLSQILLQRILNLVIPELMDRLKLIKLYLDAVRDQRESQPVPPAPSPPFRSMAAGDAIYRSLVPSYTVFFAFFLIHMMALSFVRERHQGTLTRLCIAPLPRSCLLVGKSFAFFVLSVSQGIILFLAARLLFGISLGPMPWLLLPVIVSTSLAATALGLFLATAFGSETQVHAWASLIVISMAAVSGCMVPRDWLSSFLREFSLYVTPHAWALRAYDQLLYAARPPLGQVALSCFVLAAFATLFFALGWWRFNRKGVVLGENS